MRNVGLIAGRELGAYFRSMGGYVIFALVLIIDGLIFNAFVLGESEQRSSEVLGQFFYYTSGLLMAASVLLSMRFIAEEKQTGTINLLASSPVRDREIILGKYLAGLAFLGIITLSTLYMPLLILVNGKISFGHLFAGYLGLFLLSGTTLAVGTFGSALARSQILAVVISAVLVLILIIAWMLARVTERPLNEFFVAIALFHRHFTPFMAGVIHLRDVVYYVMMSYFALFLATRVLEARRWK
jgi:ABC-2 type transport system permease protein